MEAASKGKLAQDKQKPARLSDRQYKILAYIEQAFWTNGAIPTNEKISEILEIPLHFIKKCWEDQTFRTALTHRGVDFSPERSKGLLTPVQLTLANSLLNMHDKRSVREKLKECGVTSSTYNGWLSAPAFRNYLASRGEQLFGSHDHEAYAALLGVATAGDVSALKLFFEMRGIYNPKVSVEVNIPQVLGQVVEIITRHVTDPGTLAAIAEDIAALQTGGHRPAVQRLPIPEIAEVSGSNMMMIDI